MTTNAFQASALLGLLTETSLHAGAGRSLGAIDLPIQREAHTDWPCVYGSAVKGALRAKGEGMGLSDLTTIFGPDTKNADKHAGALMVGDARLVLLPVRSLTGHFRWATCPALLKRLKDDARRLGVNLPDYSLPEVEPEQALVPEGEGELFLEEYRVTARQGELAAVVEALCRLMGEDEGERLNRQLVVLDNDLFTHLARYGTPVAAHVRIEHETKTVAEGALWYEETLPPETLLYVALGAWRSRKENMTMEAGQVLDGVLSGMFETGPYLQLGGNETVGMGWCRVMPVRAGEA